METNLIVTTPERLQSIVENAVITALKREQESQPAKRSMNLEQFDQFMRIQDVVNFLYCNGVSITQATIYRRVSDGTFPYQKVNNRLMFEKSEVLQWIELNSKKHNAKRANNAAALAKSAKNQGEL